MIERGSVKTERGGGLVAGETSTRHQTEVTQKVGAARPVPLTTEMPTG